MVSMLEKAESIICTSVGLSRQNLDERMVVIGDDNKSIRSTLKSWILNHIESPECFFGKRSVNNSDPVFVFTQYFPTKKCCMFFN